MERSCELLVAVDSSQAEYQRAAQGFLSAFSHFGMPHQLVDLAKQRLTRKEWSFRRAWEAVSPTARPARLRRP
jgi:hypothetical protein